MRHPASLTDDEWWREVRRAIARQMPENMLVPLIAMLAEEHGDRQLNDCLPEIVRLFSKINKLYKEAPRA